VHLRGGAEKRKGCDGDAADTFAHAVAPVGAPSVQSCGGAEERKGYDGDAAATYAHAVAPVGARVARLQEIVVLRGAASVP
jgi:hypothetical protein